MSAKTISQSYNPPIVEGIISMKCEPSPLTKEIPLDSLSTEITEKYPIRSPLFDNEKTDISGFELKSFDGKQIARFEQDGFSFHRLAPYDSLDNYLSDIEALWNSYKDTSSPVVLKKMSMRYINRIFIPFDEDGSLDLTKYLQNTPPNLGKYNKTLKGMFQSLLMHCPESKCFVKLTTASESSTERGLTIILDIESFYELDEKPKPFLELMPHFGKLRDLKNHAFQTTLTDKCQNLFQP